MQLKLIFFAGKSALLRRIFAPARNKKETPKRLFLRHGAPC